MQLLPLFNQTFRKTPAGAWYNFPDPCPVLDLIADYITEADRPAQYKRYFYGRLSLKWCLLQIISSSPLEKGDKGGLILPAANCQLPTATLLHHAACQLALLPIQEAEDMLQYEADKLKAFSYYKSYFSETKKGVHIPSLQKFSSGGYKFVINPTEINLTSLIFRRTWADCIIHCNPELQAASITFRVNSSIMQNETLRQHITTAITTSEPGWRTLGTPAGVWINHGIRKNTPTFHTPETLTQIIKSIYD